MPKSPTWTPRDLEMLREMFVTSSWSEMVHALGRTKPAIEQKAKSIGCVRLTPKAKLWDEQDTQLLKDLYAVAGARKVAEMTGRALSAVLKKAQALGVKSHRREMIRVSEGPHEVWTESDDEKLRLHYATKDHAALASMLGRSEQALYARARKLGIQRGGKPGRKPMAVGSERMTLGRLERRVAMTGVRKADWKRVAAINWEAEHGPIPEGYVLIVPRDSQNDMRTHRLVPRAEVPILNAIANATPEWRELVRLKSQFGWHLRHIEKRDGSPTRESRQSCKWTDSEVEFLLANHGCLPLVDIAKTLGRTKKALLRQLQKRGKAKPVSRWSGHEDRKLAALFAHHTTAELAVCFQRSVPSICHRASRLGLRKREGYGRHQSA